MTKTKMRILVLLLSCTVFVLPSFAAQEQTATARDGQHDFDFNIGTWHTHIKRIIDPFSASPESMELNGTVFVRKIWDGAELEEIEADGPKGHWEGLTLFLYNPQSHQWSQNYASGEQGKFENPTIGSFKDGRADLYGTDTFDGKSILVRGTWSDITPDSHRYEEDNSDDGGKTWKPAFVAELTRESKITSEIPPIDATPDPNGQHGFDFDFGTWKTHSSRLVHPLTGSRQWMEMDGVTTVAKVWNGRGNLAVLESDGRKGHLELLALRLYNPQSHQWSINFATSDVGSLSVPCIGRFKNGFGEFYDQEDFGGRTIQVRFTFRSISPTSAQSEQSFSEDGGKTWEVNWINKYTRVK